MPLRKIADIKPPCTHSEHNPPSMIVLSPGVYEHRCPNCGMTCTFTVAGNYCETGLQHTGSVRIWQDPIPGERLRTLHNA